MSFYFGENLPEKVDSLEMALAWQYCNDAQVNDLIVRIFNYVHELEGQLDMAKISLLSNQDCGNCKHFTLGQDIGNKNNCEKDWDCYHYLKHKDRWEPVI